MYLVGCIQPRITMHGTTNIKFNNTEFQRHLEHGKMIMKGKTEWQNRKRRFRWEFRTTLMIPGLLEYCQSTEEKKKLLLSDWLFTICDNIYLAQEYTIYSSLSFEIYIFYWQSSCTFHVFSKMRCLKPRPILTALYRKTGLQFLSFVQLQNYTKNKCKFAPK